MLAVFDVFASANPSLTAEEITSRLQYSRGTAYRYIRELASAGFLKKTGGAYSLGPRIVELDYLIRQNDRLLHIVQPALRALSERLECDTLWVSFFGDRIVVTQHERGISPLVVSYGRGRRMPLFRGAGSKTILSVIPVARLKRLYEANVEEVRAAGLGESWPAFRGQMAAIRRAGYSISKGELDRGNVGLSAPLVADPSQPPGSIVFVFNDNRFAVADEKRLISICVEAASKLSQTIAAEGHPEMQENSSEAAVGPSALAPPALQARSARD